MPRFTYKLDFPDLETISKRGMDRVRREAGRAVMEEFKALRMGRRFSGGASTELGWTRRQGYWNRIKSEVTGRSRVLPMVFRGNTAARFRAAVPRATRGMMTLEATGLNAGFRRGTRTRGGVNLREEIAELTGGELQGIADRFAELMAEGMVREMGRVRVRESG